MKNLFAFLVFLFAYFNFGIISIYAQEMEIIKRFMTETEFIKIKNSVGTYEEGKNYNKIYNGHGTGLMPPTEEQWEEMKNQPLIIDIIESPSGIEEVPASHDNSVTIWFPPIGNQGSEGSCVSWACVYYTKTFQEAREHNWDLSGASWTQGHPSAAYQDKIFSPDFVYHQVNNGTDNGSSYPGNIDILNRIGCCTWDKMPYDPADHTTWPNENAWRQAPWYRSGSMLVNANFSIENLKQILVNGNLPIININPDYYANLTSVDLWTLDNYSGGGGHANTVVGYDDNYGPFTESGNSNTYGAFKVANSWGKGRSWENVSDGFYYISYECMKQRVSFIYLYQNYIEYIPQMVAVFEMNQSLRGENLIDVGKGTSSSPAAFKSFDNRLYDGSISYPNNPMVVDITEFTPYMSGSNDQFFFQVYNEGTIGTIQYFSIEMYDDYSSGIPTKVYTSTETPVSTQQDIAVTVNVFTSAETIIITYPKGGEEFEVGSNPVITYTSSGTSGYINLDYSTNAGTSWNTIANNIEDNGSYSNWTVPNILSANCKIRISDADGNPSVISKGLFRIGPYELFTEQTSIALIGTNSGSVVWGDYDNDSDLDILLTGLNVYDEFISKIYSNNGNNTFKEETTISLIGVAHSSADWGDYDNDGDLDIFLCGCIKNGPIISRIYRNNGNNTFTELTSMIPTGVQDGSTDWADYDNDGDLDILLTGSTESGPISKIYQNNGNNAFTEQTSISLTNVYACSAAWGDYDNDGDFDILLTGWCESGYISKIYRNNGNNTFTEQTSISLTGVRDASTAWGDYDNDGDLDILLTGIKSSPVSKIYRNDGNNTFTEQTSIYLVGFYGGSSLWGDYDNDGDLDILLIGHATPDGWVIKIYRNNGNNTFTEQFSISLDYGRSSAWGDYDNDGDLDILLAGGSPGSKITKVYNNNTITPNIPPAVPSNLKTVINGIDVTFSWNKSTDTETPQNGLTYNLVIGTSPGARNILSPMSDRNTGYRRIVGLGNTNHDTSWTIKGLPYGKYYWSVQAIDNCFAGSSFAPEEVIAVPLPVELTSFKANVQSSGVLLDWETATEINNYGFEIERRISIQTLDPNLKPELQDESHWYKIGFVEGNGNSNSPKRYSYKDKNPAGGNKFEYRLKQIDLDGTFEYSDIVDVIILPTEYKLFQNYPNPFNPTTTIRYSVPKEGLISIKVYDITGREVITLINEVQLPGNYEVLFDASDLSSGVYFYRMIAPDYSTTKQLMILK